MTPQKKWEETVKRESTLRHFVGNSDINNYFLWVNPINTDSLRLYPSAAAHIKRTTNLQTWKIPVTVFSTSNSNILKLEKIMTCPYTIPKNGVMVSMDEDVSVILVLNGGDLDRYIENCLL